MQTEVKSLTVWRLRSFILGFVSKFKSCFINNSLCMYIQYINKNKFPNGSTKLDNSFFVFVIVRIRFVWNFFLKESICSREKEMAVVNSSRQLVKISYEKFNAIDWNTKVEPELIKKLFLANIIKSYRGLWTEYFWTH